MKHLQFTTQLKPKYIQEK